jgi:hypothetical protein
MSADTKLLPCPDDCIVHILPCELERLSKSECTATVASVAFGTALDGDSVPIYTADQMLAFRAADPVRQQLVDALKEITAVAEMVDNYASFPSKPIEKAYAALAAAGEKP